jgi:hypothetical protein
LRRVEPPRPSAVRQAIAQAGERVNLLQPDLAIVPLGVLYTDFTELRYAGGKAWLMTLLDHTLKLVVGWAIAPSPDTELALPVRSGPGQDGTAWRLVAPNLPESAAPSAA